jgi:UDP-glucose:(heptosyl)LPS alpha-1,3-glucosyltransferase
MNVALSFPGCHRRGGVERVVYECARFLAARNHRVSVVSQDFESIPGVRHLPVPGSRSPSLLSSLAYSHHAPRRIRNAGFDVLATHGTVCPRWGVHWVQSVHRAWLERAALMRPPGSLARLKQRLNPAHLFLLHLEEKHFRNRAYRRLIATTPRVRDDLLRLYGVPPEDVEILPNGFSPSEFNPERRAQRRELMRRRLGLLPNETVLLFAANELARKGFPTLLSALRALRSHRFRVLVTGRPCVREIRSAARKMGVEDFVLACGSTNEIADYHAAADLFVLPTQYEAFSLAILEALASGLPVITSSVPGARDAIRPGVNGFLLQNPLDGKELASVLRNLCPAQIASLSAQAPRTVESHQWPRLLLRYEAILAQAAQSSAPTRTP